MESKNPDEVVLKKLEMLRYECHHLVSPTGHGAGGLGLFWKQELNLQIVESNAHVIDTIIEFEGKSFYSSFIHGSTDRKERLLLWDCLVSKAIMREAPWFVTGDFNDILYSEEKEGGTTRPEGSFSDLRTFFAEGDLFDLQHSGDPLSWRGQRGEHLVRCRLDRAAANTLWAENFPTARCQYLEADLSSDHKPLMVFFDNGSRRRRGMFRYDRRLCKDEEAKKFISEAWRESSGETVAEKLAATRSAISAWNKTQHRNSQKIIEEKKRELDKALSSPVNDTVLIQEINAKLNSAYLAEEEYWRQRSRLMWLKLGDRNTGFFHAVTKAKKRANGFSVLENEEGVMVHKEEEIINVIGSYFQNLFTTVPGEREEIVRRALKPMVTEEENMVLTATPSPEEIREAVFSINAEKSPGPDGFSAGFFHTHWADLGPDIIGEVQGFFNGEPLPCNINETNIRLIPKITNPQKVSDYRPIALCNVYYKIYSKLLTRRLQPLLDKIISENQSAFVLGRSIGDNVLITHEVLHYLKTSQAEQRCAMAVKTDMSKAYDRLEWEFIEHVLLRLGFHQKFVNCLMQCVSSVTYSFLINGLPRGKVVPSRGIRQGDPLSPYIFIMCSEVLSGLCNRAQEDGLLKGLRVARACPRVNHLLFADDTMFFLEATKGNCETLISVLADYELASGQSINKDKSAITFSKKTPASLKSMTKDALQIYKEGGTGKYLGLPEQFSRRRRDLFASIVDKVKQKARGWTTKFLSSAGKLVMIQSVLSAVPSYSMNYFALPVSLCRQIQSVVTRFWWDSNEGVRKMAWVSWEAMAKPKAIGGLRLRDFQTFNVALLAKTSWRLLQKPNCLLGRVLMGKYCQDSNILQVTASSSMSHGWRTVLLGRDLLIKNLGWIIGNGQSIEVWQDPWLSSVRQERPMGPPNEHLMKMRVSDLMTPESCEWDREKIQRIIPAYEEQVLLLKPSQTGAPDKIVWLGTKTGQYSTKSGYFSAVSTEESRNGELQGAPFNWNKAVWSLDCAPKVKQFAWKLLKGALPVGESLVERNIPVDPLCKRCGDPESISHLFFHCRYAREVWGLAPFTTDVNLRGMIDLVSIWTSLCSLKCLPPAGVLSDSLAIWILWGLWKARNKFVFEGHSCTPKETLNVAIVLAREWSSKLIKSDPVKRCKSVTPRILPPHTMIIRSDAAWSQREEKAGLGWVVFSNAGIRLAMKKSLHVASALMAESLAMLEAMRWGVSEGIRSICFESDSAVLINCLTTGEVPSEIYGVVADIVSFSSTLEFVCFSWIPRGKNIQADNLAKCALAVAETLVVDGVVMTPN